MDKLHYDFEEIKIESPEEISPLDMRLEYTNTSNPSPTYYRGKVYVDDIPQPSAIYALVYSQSNRTGICWGGDSLWFDASSAEEAAEMFFCEE